MRVCQFRHIRTYVDAFYCAEPSLKSQLFATISAALLVPFRFKKTPDITRAMQNPRQWHG
jgi:hypothetical protein